MGVRLNASGTRRSASAPICLLCCVLCASSAVAQAPKPPTVEQVRVGLPANSTDPDSGYTRQGAWAPVYVKIKAGDEAIAPGTLRLVAEGVDGEDATYQYGTPLPAAAAGEDLFAVTYVRPGMPEFSLSIQGPNGSAQRFLVPGPGGRSSVTTHINRNFMQGAWRRPSDVVYLALGSRLGGLRRAMSDRPPAGDDEAPVGAEDGPRQLAFLDNARDLPDRWFGYDAVDVVVLATSSDTFVGNLLEPAAAGRRKALGEWVRRGGKLVVAVGRNRQLVAKLLDEMPLPEFDRQPLINCAVGGAIPRRALPVLANWATDLGREPPVPLQDLEITALRPDATPTPGAEGVNVLVREPPEGKEKDGPPLIVHAACGLGRVVLVGLDLDTPPFSTWPGQRAFWLTKLEDEFDLHPPVTRVDKSGMGISEETVLADGLKRGLESFQEVPVISFGWVALFILVYIVIVGPLDYLILKKVFKRLELTWITFPTVVIAISVAAYFTAYALKGDDLRVNKIDVIDVDLHGPTPQAYGATWVTVFSPRIQNYTVGVEPAAPAWADAPASDAPASRTLVTVMESLDPRTSRLGSQGLFRRPYTYASDASGLEGVPIPVWSMRTFTARWRGAVTPGQAPLEADLHHARDPNDPALLGRIGNRLPVALKGVTLLYKGRSYSGGTIEPGGFLPVDNLRVGDNGPQASQWLTSPASLAADSLRTVTGQDLVKGLLFHGPPAQVAQTNAGWRELDQSWRLRAMVEARRPKLLPSYREEVVLVARVGTLSGRSEDVTRKDASPTRLWLNDLPGPGKERPGLSGYLVQDGYVRAFLPVTP